MKIFRAYWTDPCPRIEPDGRCWTLTDNSQNGDAMALSVRRPGLKNVSFATLALVVLSLAPAGRPAAKDLTGLVGVSAAGQPDIATFAQVDDPAGISVPIYSGATGKALQTIIFLDGRYEGKALERIVQMPGTGRAALAVLATRLSSNRHVVEVRNPLSGAFIADYRVLNSLWDMVDLTVIDDLDGDGNLNDPALAILARLPSSGKILVQIIRLSDGVVVANRAYLNRLWTPLAIAAAQRPGMPTLLAILAVLPSSNKLLIESRLVSNGAFDRHSRPLNRLWAGQDLSSLTDLNGDGDLSDPAWLVLARNPNSGANVVQALQVSDGASGGLSFVLNRLWQAARLATSADLNANDQEDLIVAASRPANGNNVINLSDFASGESLRNIFPAELPPPPEPGEPIRVSALSPAPGSDLDAAPTEIVAVFHRDPDASTVNENTFILEASGGDGTFGEANDVQIMVDRDAITVPLNNPSNAIFDLTGVALADDTYRVRLLGSGPSIILDMDANALDGEFTGAFPSGDGVQGGDFEAQFTISTPPSAGATLAEIQAAVFTPSCAGCHSGPTSNSLPSGMNLSNTDASFAALVRVASLQQPSLFRVAPGDPDRSYLVQKLEGTAATGGRMPAGRGPLDPDLIADIREWIANGAERSQGADGPPQPY